MNHLLDKIRQWLTVEEPVAPAPPQEVPEPKKSRVHTKVPCIECGRMVAITATGNLYRHYQPDGFTLCPGREPLEQL